MISKNEIETMNFTQWWEMFLPDYSLTWTVVEEEMSENS